jgi:type I restriction enzyme S subunit
VPRLWFPEFQEAGEWDLAPLETYFPRIRNGFVGTATPYYVASGIPYLQGKNIKQGKIDEAGLVSISSEFHQLQKKSQLHAVDILMVQSGHVGECAIVGERFSGGNCHALIILSPCKNVDSRFFVYYFYSPQGQGKIFVITTGNTIKHILASDLQVLEVIAPVIEEQQKIANCLSSLDDLITAQTQKIATLKTHKKALMQQLFPRLEGA